MSPLRPFSFGRIALSILALALSGTPFQPGLAGESARMNGGAKVDCITPDGRLVAVPNAASIMDDDTLICPLQEGETTFIISFPKSSLLDRFTFINENTAAQGEMRIAVSNHRLPAASPEWIDVAGKTEFTSKRLFNLSMLGVEARYVKLSFSVAKGGRIASMGLSGGGSLKKYVNQQDGIAHLVTTQP